jgi:hypothetical protein
LVSAANTCVASKDTHTKQKYRNPVFMIIFLLIQPYLAVAEKSRPAFSIYSKSLIG